MNRGVIILFLLIELFLPDSGPGERVLDLLSILEIITALITLIYQTRLYLGLIEVFGRKKRWILLWIFVDFIPACLWGWTKGCQPLWTVEEMGSSADTFFSNSKVAVLDQGLTVNLERLHDAVDDAGYRYLDAPDLLCR